MVVERKLAVERLRLRHRAVKESPFQSMSRCTAKPSLAQRMHGILPRGLSTRKYAAALRRVARGIGVYQESSASREPVPAS